MSERLTVEVWTDLICPWCWIGEQRFARALAAFPQREHVALAHRSFRLMPGQRPMPTVDMLAGRFGSPQQARAMMAHVEGEGAKEGLAYRLSNSLAGDTLDAHRLVKLAEASGLGEAAIERLYRAYFIEERSLFDHATLLALVTEVGVDEARAAEVLRTDAFAAEVLADQRAVQAMGATGVPFFVIGGRVAVSGAEPPATFLGALEQAWAGRTPSVQAAGEVCGPDSCA
ncbi:MAG: DsbA family oxidoreductase [Gammaproteobacteria bacterium]